MGNQVEPGEAVVLRCENGVSMEMFLHLSLLPAVLVVGVLSFLQRRRRPLAVDFLLPSLGGRFAVVVPLDSIGSFSNRWSYGFAFGAASYGVLLLFSENYLPFSVPPWATVVVYLAGSLEVGLAYFPLFACLSTPFRSAGAVMGLLYCLAWAAVTAWDTFTCPSGEILGRYQKIIIMWPSILSLVFLLGRFVYILVKDVQLHLRQEEVPEELTEQHHLQHVHRLLRRTAGGGEAPGWFQSRVYRWDPAFKFPNRVLGTAIISLIGLYAATLADYSLSSIAFDRLETWKDLLKDLAGSCNRTQALEDALPRLEELLTVARRTWTATTIFASMNSVAYTLHVLVCYRKHLRRLWRGEKDFIPAKFHSISSAVSVASIARYSGWQIAFTLWGFLIVHFVHFLLALVFVYLLILPVQHGHALSMLSNLGIIILTISLVVAMVILQVVLVQLFFLQDKLSPSDPDKPLALNNRKAFHCFSYFFFFYNVILGISSCILRLLSSVVVGTWLVSRIDRTIMQRGYEGLDAGYSTWVGMIFADHHHSNPSMVCFCQLLVSCSPQGRPPASYHTFGNTLSEPRVSGRARRRWALVYTLLRNPHLIPLRKHRLSSPDPFGPFSARLPPEAGFSSVTIAVSSSENC